MPTQHDTPQAAQVQQLPLAGRDMELLPLQRPNAAQRALEDAPGGSAAAPLQMRSVLSAGAAVRRYDWMRDRAYMEVLDVSEASVRLDRLRAGISLLDNHDAYSGVRSVYGVVEDPQIQPGRLEGNITFSRRDEAAGVRQDVQDRVLRSVSVGYIRHRVQMEPPEQDGGLWTYRVVDWEPFEVSLVGVPADMDAQIMARSAQATPQDGAEKQARVFDCQFLEVAARSAPASTPSKPAAGQAEETHHRKDEAMPGITETGGANTPADPTPTTPQAQQRQADPAADVLARTAEIAELCARHGVPELAPDLIRRGATVEAASKAVLDKLAISDAASGGHRNVRTLQDEGETRMLGLGEALMARVDAQAKLTENGRQYRGMSLLDMGREVLEMHGINTRGLSKMDLAGRALNFRADAGYRSGGPMTTSDFPSLLANVANKRLRRGYDENPGTYAMWARRAPNAPDFKSMTVVQLGNAPSLLPVNEAGEFKYGAMTDGKETYAIGTHGRIVHFSRQAMINDDLRGFDRLLTAFGAAANRLENALVYAQLTSNPTMSDGTALFHADHANITTGVISTTSLGAARALMRKQTGFQGELLNLTPSYILVPAALEQKAYEFTSANYVPASKAEINEFRAGGRTALEPIVEPLLDATSATQWYLAAMSSQVDTVEYCWLDGAEGPVVEMENGFDVDGMKFKCREDFAAKVIDHRGLVRSTGA